jgi:hypothetical protein
MPVLMHASDGRLRQDTILWPLVRPLCSINQALTLPQLAKEFSKPGVQQTLRQGGNYLLLVGHDYMPTIGKRRVGTTRDKLQKELARLCKLKKRPISRCKIMFGDQIARWASRYLAIAATAGGVGGLAVQLAKARGAMVISLASESKVDLVKGLGADHVFDYGKDGWSAAALGATRSQGVQVFLDSSGDLASEALPLLTQFGRWMIYGVRTGQHNALPAEALWPMIEKNISLIGFNLEGSLQHVPRALGELFKFVIDGSVKVEIAKYPLTDASIVPTLFEERKTTGKVVSLP